MARESYRRNPEAVKHAARKWAEKNPIRRREIAYNSKLKAKYGIEFSDYQKMLEQQGGKCAICGGDGGVGRSPGGQYVVDGGSGGLPDEPRRCAQQSSAVVGDVADGGEVVVGARVGEHEGPPVEGLGESDGAQDALLQGAKGRATTRPALPATVPSSGLHAGSSR